MLAPFCRKTLIKLGLLPRREDSVTNKNRPTRGIFKEFLLNPRKNENYPAEKLLYKQRGAVLPVTNPTTTFLGCS